MRETDLMAGLERFGLTAFRPGQREAVEALLSGRDAVCVFPTGGGKSLCYQLPAVLHAGCGVVISPLIALMRDQVRHLSALGIPAGLLSSAQTEEERAGVLRAWQAGRLKLLYLSPERLASPAFREALRHQPPWLVAVDEAHCVDRWGRDFRPEYREIGAELERLSPRPVRCAMTATADRRCLRLIRHSMKMRNPRQVILPMTRENLILRVHPTMHREESIRRFAGTHSGQGIVYTPTRKAAENAAALLQAEAYHAGLPPEDRQRIQDAFAQEACRTVAATVAFGMGVDATHVRWILMDGLPDTLADYAQQAGRAGRDGADAECLALCSPKDMAWRLRRIHMMRKDRNTSLLRRILETARQRRELQRLADLLLGNRCIPAALSKAFGQRSKPCGRCSACLRKLPYPGVPRLAHLDGETFRCWWLGIVCAEFYGGRDIRPPAAAEMRDALRTGRFRRTELDEPALRDWLLYLHGLRI